MEHRNYFDRIARTLWKLRAILGIRKTSYDKNGILIFATTFLGDLFMMSPFITALRRSYPAKKLTLVVRADLAEIANILPVDTVIPAKKPSILLWHEISALRRSWWRAYFLFSDKWIPMATSLEIGRRYSTETKKNRYSKVLDRVAIVPSQVTALTDIPLRLLNEDENRNISDIPIDRWKPENEYAILHLGARNEARNLNSPQIMDVINALNYLGFKKIKITGTNKNNPRFSDNEISYANKFVQIVDLREKTNLSSLVAELSNANLLIGVDTGVIHLSKALGVPTISFLGQSQSTLFGKDNHYSRSIHIGRNDLECKDKKTIFGIKRDWIKTCARNKCPFETRACIDSLGIFDKVISSVSALDELYKPTWNVIPVKQKQK